MSSHAADDDSILQANLKRGFGEPVAVTRTDVARIEAGRIASLHVFIDQPDA
jgi:hypothetical protein